MENIKHISITVLVIVIISLVVWKTCERDDDGYVQVRQTWLDSLQHDMKMLLEQEPEIVEVVRDSIIYEKGPVEYVRVPVPVEVDDEYAYYEDTLKTPYFDVFLYDTLRSNRIVSRGFNYDIWIPVTEIKTITQIQKVPYPYKVDDRARMYGGINAGSMISADLSYRMGDNYIGAGVGYGLAGRFYYVRYQKRLW